MKMDIVVHVAGGLANKMFHCALAIVLQNEGHKVSIDTESQKIEFEHDKLSLWGIFPRLNLSQMPPNKYKYGGDMSLFGKIMRRLPLITGERYYINHAHLYTENFISQIKHDGYIIGYFQNEQYFKKYDNKIREAFSFAPILDERNIQLVNELLGANSVAIHVRKGDGYATWDEFKGTCPNDYYKKAVTYLKGKYQNLKFYVFTDSVIWVKENFSWLEYTLVDWNPSVGWGNHFDMQLMSLCKHNIIANSTYSWWGAWLNSNPQKEVIAPMEWFNLNSRVKHQSEIVPVDWIKI